MEEQLPLRDGKLSIAIIAKNEQNCIAKCLESIKDADEIIFVDTGSSDITPHIAQEYTKNVYFLTWNDDFSAAKNFASKKCSHEWILSIDADDELEPGGIRKIRKAIKKKNIDSLIIEIESKDKGLTYFLPRVYKNTELIRWQGKAHNRLVGFEKALKTNIKMIRGFSPAHEKDPNRAIRILENALKENSSLIRERYYLGKEYAEARNFEKAILWLKEYTHKANREDELADAYLLLAKIYRAKDKADLAKLVCSLAIAVNPDFKEAIEYMAYLESGRKRERWISFCKEADNRDVLFIRHKSWLGVK